MAQVERVVEAVGEDVEAAIKEGLARLAHQLLPPFRSVSRMGPKPSSPSQKSTRLSTPRVVKVAPARPSTWCDRSISACE